MSDHRGSTVLSEGLEEVEGNYSLLILSRDNPHKKVCYKCFTSCKAKLVTCGYCNGVVDEDEKSLHMSSMHPMISESNLWPVRCAQDNDKQPEMIVGRPIDVSSAENAKVMGSNEIFQCTVCLEILSGRADILEHIEEVHSFSGRWCPHCNTILRGVKNAFVKEHLHFCNGGDFTRCNHCSGYFGNIVTAYTHICQPEQRLTSNSTKILCVDCKDGRKGKCDIVSKQERVKCKLCLQFTADYDHLQHKHPFSPTQTWVVGCHKKTSDWKFYVGDKVDTGSDFVYQCLTCSMSYSLQDELIEHYKKAHPPPKAQKDAAFYKCCPHCDAVLRMNKTIYFFKDHEQFCGKGTCFSCESCGLSCSSTQSMQNHIRKKHKGVGQKDDGEDACFSGDMNTEQSEVMADLDTYSEEDQTSTDLSAPVLCVDCKDGRKGRCEIVKKRERVKCKLCLQFTEDYSHFQYKHPYTPAQTWTVGCHKKETDWKFYIGEKFMSDLGTHFRCIDCQQLFLTQDDVIEHFKESHPQKDSERELCYYKCCPFCEAVLRVKKKSSLYRDHVYFCEKGTSVKCDKCSVCCSSMQNLGKHKRLMHQENQTAPGEEDLEIVKLEPSLEPVAIPKGTIFQCIECTFSTSAYKDLRTHNMSLHGYNEQHVKQICRYCFRVFKIKSHKERHIQQEHLGGEKCLCAECGADFETPSKLYAHNYYHHAGGRNMVLKWKDKNRGREKVCHQCGQVFKTTFRLNVHVRLVHENSQEYKCQQCDKKLFSKSSLRCHMYRHKQFKPYQCAHCPFRDYTGYAVNKHCQAKHAHLVHTKDHMSFKVKFEKDAFGDLMKGNPEANQFAEGGHVIGADQIDVQRIDMNTGVGQQPLNQGFQPIMMENQEQMGAGGNITNVVFGFY